MYNYNHTNTYKPKRLTRGGKLELLGGFNCDGMRAIHLRSGMYMYIYI